MPFNKNIQELIDFLNKLPPHEKLQEISKILLFRGRYHVLKETLSDINFCFVLDSVNYSSLLFDDPLPMKDILDVLNVEPGYGSVTGNIEIGDVIREFEISRAYAFANQYHLLVKDIRDVIEDTIVLTTFGATGGIYTALMALLARERTIGRNRTGIVFNAPTYCLPDAFARLHGLTPIPVFGTRENNFFPPLALIHEACLHSSVFACVLTYPNNPAQHSFRENEMPELLRLIAYCQSNQIQLIADTVFQELRWLSAPPVPELFALADSSEFLCKVFSPSKDRSFASGYRVGYLIADKALVPWLEQVVSCTTSSPNTLSQIWLAIDVAFRSAMLAGGLNQAFIQPLKNSPIFGFGVKQDMEKIYHKICDANLYDNYVQRVNKFMGTLDKGLDKVWHWLRASEYFEVDERPPYGNTLMVRIPAQAPFQNEFEYYFKVLLTRGVIASMGGCFGVPSDEGIYFRVVVASYPPELVIAILGYVKEALLSNKTSE